jgi:alpha(1,3/1,4) fucosyltransferase
MHIKIIILILLITIIGVLVYKLCKSNELFTNKTLKVYTTDWWNNKQENFITDILYLKYPNSKFNFTDKDPDIIIYSVFGNKYLNFKDTKNKLYFLNEPRNYENIDNKNKNSTQTISWNYKLNGDKHIYFNGFSHRMIDINLNFNGFNNICNYLNNTSNKQLINNNPFLLLKKNKFDNDKYFKSKTNFCAFIASNCNSKDRIAFFDKLSKYKSIHSFGKCRNNANEKNFIEDNDNLYIPEHSPHKNAFLYRKFKFVICFENSSHPGYLTEKILYVMLANTIPIYWGNPDIGNVFNEKAFINVHSYNSFDDVIEKVKELDQDDNKYKRMLQEPWVKNNEITDNWRINNGFSTKQEVANRLNIIF